MRQLEAVNANFTQVFLETMLTLLAPIFIGSPNESLKEVRVVSFTKKGTGTNQYLQVVFQIFLIEKCNPGLCPTDKTSTTTLDDEAQERIANVVADGTFVTTLKAETKEAVDAGELVATDTNVALVACLNSTASTATATFKTFVFVTTAAPTNVPSKKPSSSPSSNPSSYPSTNPSSDPSMDPSSNPSGVPSTNPSSMPSRDP
jgi:hypothetical protein